METFNKELAHRTGKNFPKSMHVQDLQNPEKLSGNSIKNLNIVSRMSNIKLSIIDMEPDDVTKLDILVLDQSETYPEEDMLTKDGSNRYLYQPGE